MNVRWILWWIVNVFWVFIFVGFSISIINSYNLTGGVVDTTGEMILFFVVLVLLMLIPIGGQALWYYVMRKSFYMKR